MASAHSRLATCSRVVDLVSIKGDLSAASHITRLMLLHPLYVSDRYRENETPIKETTKRINHNIEQINYS